MVTNSQIKLTICAFTILPKMPLIVIRLQGILTQWVGRYLDINEEIIMASQPMTR